MKKTITLITLFICMSSILINAQNLFKPFESISHKKPTYITLEDGNEISGTVKKLKRKKGLIKEINIKNESGEVKTIPIEDIDFAYLPQSGLDKYMKSMDFLNDATQWDDGLYDKERIKDGYAYFEKADVMVKKKKMTLMVQLLNPGTCSKIKVYHDPFAAETASLGVGGIKVAGGDDKSYYISKDGDAAYKLAKKTYKKSFDDVYGDCKAIKKKYSDAKWGKFVEALFEYNAECGK